MSTRANVDESGSTTAPDTGTGSGERLWMDEWWWDMHWDVIRCVCEALYEAIATRRQFGIVREMPPGWMAELESAQFCVTPESCCDRAAIGVKFYAYRIPPGMRAAPHDEPEPPEDEESRPEERVK